MKTTLLLALACAFVDLAHAQIPDLPSIAENWEDVGYPKVFYTTRDGLTGGIFYAQYRPPGYEDWNDPAPYRASLSVDGQISASGSNHLGFYARMPNLVPGWRFVFRLRTQRRARDNYYGLGNYSEYDKQNVTDAQPHYYQADFHRFFVRGEVQKRIKSRLRFLAGFHAERWSVDTLPGPSALALHNAGGSSIPIGTSTTDISARFGLVLDTRNDEIAPTRGVLIQAILGVADSSVAGATTYTRTTISGSAFWSPRPLLTFAGRLTGQAMTGNPGFGSLLVIESSDQPIDGFGGYESHRGLPPRRFVAEDALLANLEARWVAVGLPTVLTISLLGFVDVGRVFHPGEDTFRLTTDGLHLGAGFGPVLSYGRTAVIGLTFSAGPEGARVHAMTDWAF